jgi:hypothetical protein
MILLPRLPHRRSSLCGRILRAWPRVKTEAESCDPIALWNEKELPMDLQHHRNDG